MTKFFAHLRSAVLHFLLLHWESFVEGLVSPPHFPHSCGRRELFALRYGGISNYGRDRSDSLRDRDSPDFLRLEDNNEEYGPGPAIIFYNVPHGLQDEDLVDMLRDQAPRAFGKGVSLSRMDSSTPGEWMDLSLNDALNKLITNSKDPAIRKSPDPLTTDAGLLATTPVLFFSGFRNSEMMSAFHVISHKVHKETGGRLTVACATASPYSMETKLRQVLLEISGDG